MGTGRICWFGGVDFSFTAFKELLFSTITSKLYQKYLLEGSGTGN
jgi:hypothetical protein